MPLPALKPLNYKKPLYLSSCSETHTEKSSARRRAAGMEGFNIFNSAAVTLIHT